MKLFYQIYASGTIKEIYGENAPFLPETYASVFNCIVTKLGKIRSFIDDEKQYKIYLDDEYSTEIKISRSVYPLFLHVSSTSPKRTAEVYDALVLMFGGEESK